MTNSMIGLYFFVASLLQILLVSSPWSFGCGPSFIITFALVPTMILYRDYRFVVGGMISAIFCGIVLSMVSVEMVISLGITLGICIFLKKIIASDTIIAIGFVTILASLIMTICSWGFYKLVFDSYSIIYAIKSMGLSVIWNLLISIILYFPMVDLGRSQRRNRYKRWQ